MEEQTQNKEESIKDMLGEIKKQQEQLLNNKEDKKWKLPWNARVSKGQASKGYATIQIIRNNGAIEFTKKQITDGIVEIDGFPRIATVDYKIHHKGSPWYIIPEWSMKPFSPVENYNETERDKMNMVGRRAILSRLVSDKLNPQKKGMGSMGWWILGIAGIVAIYFFSKGGKIF